MTHDFYCTCTNCSDRRRDFWMRGEPIAKLTEAQTASAKIVFAVAAIGSAFGLIWGLFGCAPLRAPACGEYRTRASDGAECRECRDTQGPYAECGLRVWKTR